MTLSNISRYLKKIEEELGNKELQVGWFKDAKYPNEDKTPVAYVAAIQELGVPSRSIPARPFMRPTFKTKKDRWIQLFAQGLAQQKTGQQIFDSLGLSMVGDIREAITDVTTPPLSKVTLALRKIRKDGGKVTGKTVGQVAGKLARGENVPLSSNTKPLNETGYMLATLTYRIETNTINT